MHRLTATDAILTDAPFAEMLCLDWYQVTRQFGCRSRRRNDAIILNLYSFQTAFDAPFCDLIGKGCWNRTNDIETKTPCLNLLTNPLYMSAGTHPTHSLSRLLCACWYVHGIYVGDITFVTTSPLLLVVSASPRQPLSQHLFLLVSSVQTHADIIS